MSGYAIRSRVSNGYVLYDGDEYCHYCGYPIITMCFKGTGVCCEDCRKQRDGES